MPSMFFFLIRIIFFPSPATEQSSNVIITPFCNQSMKHAFWDSLRDHTLSASDALDEAVFPGREVVLVSPATTV